MSQLPSWLWLYLAGALLIPGRPLYTLFYLMGGLWLMAHLSLNWALRGLQVERQLTDDRLFAGERIAVGLRFTNPTGVPIPWLQYTESRPAGLAPQPLSGIISLDGGGSQVIRYEMPTHRRGRYQIGPLRWTAGDPFGFFRLEGLLSAPTQVTIYPRVSALPELGLPARLPMGDLASRWRLFEDPTWLAGTRPYEAGDSLKRIHWAATAKTGELMARQYRHAVLLPACICLNLNKEEYDSRLAASQAELAVSAAAALAHHLVERKQQVALMATGVDPDWSAEAEPTRPVFLPLQQGQQAMSEILEVLARIEPGPGRPFTEVVTEQARLLPWGTLLCLVTHKETEAVATLALRLAREGKQVLLFVQQGEGGQREGYHVWPISENRAAEVVVG